MASNKDNVSSITAYPLVVGSTTLNIPEHLIDTADFARVVIRVAPHALHYSKESNSIVKFSWQAGDLAKIGKQLKSFDDVWAIADSADCQKMGNLGLDEAIQTVAKDAAEKLKRVAASL